MEQLKRDANRTGNSASEALDGFKMTEIGELPHTWRIVPFERSIDAKRVRIGKVNRRDYKRHGLIPVVDQGQSLVAGYWNSQADAYSGDLPVVVFGDHTRVFKLVDFPFVAGADGVKVLVPDRACFDPFFLFFAYKTLDLPSRGYNRHYALLKETMLPRPPLPEQRAIARVLRTVQEAIGATERVIEAAKELKRSMMEYLFTYGPVPVDQADQVELQETEIGVIPASWSIIKMANCGTIVTGSTPSTKCADYYGGPYPFYGPGDIQDARDIGAAQKTLTRLGLEEARSLPSGTLLVVCIGASIGKMALTEADISATNQQINAVIPRSDLPSNYLYYATSRRSNALPSLAGRAAIPIVNKSVFSEFKIPLAPSGERHAIASLLSGLEGSLTALARREAALGCLFETLLHNLMRGRVRVAPTEADLEPEGTGPSSRDRMKVGDADEPR